MGGGEIVVANSMSQELRVFSAGGAWLRTLTGSPSARMRSLDRVWRSGDTIYAAEVLPTESSVWVFTLERFIARRPVGAANAGGVYPIDRFPSGQFVVTAAPRRSGQAPIGMTFVDSTPLGIFSLGDRGPPKWIGPLKNEMLMMQSIGRGRGGRVAVSYPYGRSTLVAVSGERLWVGDSESGTITQHTAAGRGAAVFSAPTPARSLDTAAIGRLRQSLLMDAMNWSDRARIEAFYAMPFPRNAPRFTRFLPGINGEMWIEQFREDPAAPRMYAVVDRNGLAIGQVRVPARVLLLEVGVADVMAVRTAEDGVQHVVRYSLRR